MFVQGSNSSNLYMEIGMYPTQTSTKLKQKIFHVNYP